MKPHYTGCEDEPYFLDSCSFCQRKLGQNCDIYMYRGNKAFCSEECRQEQIELDEANEKRWKLSSSSSSSSSSSNSSKRKTTEECESKKAVRTGTVAVA